MALTRITKGVIKPNENYDTHNINSTGIVTAIGLDVNGNADVSGSLSVGGVLTYEDVTSIDSVGIITARSGVDVDDFVSVGSNIHLGNAGVITATSFVGSGAALTGIDATAIKDSGGNVKVQAQASGAMYTGIHTFSSGAEVGSNIKLGNAGVITATSFVGSGAALTGIDATAVKDSGGNVKIQAQASGAVYTGIHTFGTNTNFTDIDVDGHTNLDNLNIAGVSTFAGTLNASTVSSTALIASGDLDVDGHTNLDNVSIAGVVTATSFVGSGANLTSLPSQLTLSNNADNRVITGGSGTNLNGEANLTFNGSLLNVSARIACDVNSDIDMSNSVDGQLVIGGDGYTSAIALNDVGMQIYHNSANRAIIFGTNETERLRITSGGDISIGGRDEALNNYAAGSTTTKLAVVKNGAGSGYHEIAHFTGGTDTNDTGAIVRITQFNNDRGLYIKGGRGTGNQAKAIFGLRNSSNSESDVMTFLEGGNIGVGVANPTAKLQVTSQTVNATTISTTNSKQLGLWIQSTGGSNTTGHIENGIAFAEGYAGLYSIDAGSGAAEHLAFFTGAAAAVSERLRITSTGQLLLTAETGTSVALLKAGGTNTDLRVASVGTGGFFDVQTQGVNNRIRVDSSGHFYQNAERTRLTYGGAGACSLRWNITSGKNLTQNNSNRDNYGKVNIQAGRANSTNINDDCVAIRITPAEVRNSAVGTKSSGIGFMHLNADQWPEYSGNQAWMGLSLNDTAGQERDRFEIHMNSQTGQGSQPNNLAMRIYPTGEMARPNQPMFFGMGRSGSFSNNTWGYIKPSSVAFDIGSNYINSGTYEGGFEAPVDGIYMCIMDGLVYPLAENQFAQTRFKKNGSVYGQVKQFNGNSSNHTGHTQVVLMQCSAGDKINQEYYTNSNSGYPYGSQWHFIVYLVG